MEYILRTKINQSGQRAFCRLQKGKLWFYILKDSNGRTHLVEKSWLKKNSDKIVNLALDAHNYISPQKADWVNSSDISMQYIPSVTTMNRNTNLKVVECYNKWLNEMFISDLEFGLIVRNGEYYFTIYDAKRNNANEYWDWSTSIVKIGQLVCMKCNLDVYDMLTRVNDLWQGFSEME